VQGRIHVLVNCANNTNHYDMVVYSVSDVPNADQVLVQLHMLFMGSVSCAVRSVSLQYLISTVCTCLFCTAVFASPVTSMVFGV
jgi:hypothetical protein